MCHACSPTDWLVPSAKRDEQWKVWAANWDDPRRDEPQKGMGQDSLQMIVVGQGYWLMHVIEWSTVLVGVGGRGKHVTCGNRLAVKIIWTILAKCLTETFHKPCMINALNAHGRFWTRGKMSTTSILFGIRLLQRSSRNSSLWCLLPLRCCLWVFCLSSSSNRVKRKNRWRRVVIRKHRRGLAYPQKEAPLKG